jgi:hypothetical protein
VKKHYLSAFLFGINIACFFIKKVYIHKFLGIGGKQMKGKVAIIIGG